jgi:hypothetical protein
MTKERFINSWKRVCIIDSDLVDCSVIDTNAGTAVGFLGEDEGKIPRGF